jgi:hypothetical protein
MGAVEEGTKVAVSISEGLRQQPLSLALIVLNIVFIVFIAWLTYLINSRTITQYKVKDDQIASLLVKLDAINDIRTELRSISDRIRSPEHK